MDAALKRLMKKIPPPPTPPASEVDWGRLESAIGLQYPVSFKEFITIYGICVWFDNLSPFCMEAKSDVEVKTFLGFVKKRLKWLEDNTYDEQFHKIEVPPLYPEQGGLFPFLMDDDGHLFCWRTEQKDSNKWPVLCWLQGPLIAMGEITIAKMILDFLDRKPHMFRIWGDINLYEPERVGITDTSQLKTEKKAKKKKNK